MTTIVQYIPRRYGNITDAIDAADIYEVTVYKHKQTTTETCISHFEKVDDKTVKFHINHGPFMIGPTIETNFPELVTCISFWNNNSYVAPGFKKEISNTREDDMYLYADEKIKFYQPFPILAAHYHRFYIQVQMTHVPDDISLEFDVYHYNHYWTMQYARCLHEISFPDNAIRIVGGISSLKIVGEPIDQDLVYTLSEEDHEIIRQKRINKNKKESKNKNFVKNLINSCLAPGYDKVD